MSLPRKPLHISSRAAQPPDFASPSRVVRQRVSGKPGYFVLSFLFFLQSLSFSYLKPSFLLADLLTMTLCFQYLLGCLGEPSLCLQFFPGCYHCVYRAASVILSPLLETLGVLLCNTFPTMDEVTSFIHLRKAFLLAICPSSVAKLPQLPPRFPRSHWTSRFSSLQLQAHIPRKSTQVK